MTVTAKTLVQTQFAPNAQTTLYTVPAATTTIIDKLTATNSAVGAQTLSVNLVPNGGSAGASNLIVSALSIAAGATVDLTQIQNQILSTGDFISVLANAASAIVIRISGREIT